MRMVEWRTGRATGRPENRGGETAGRRAAVAIPAEFGRPVAWTAAAALATFLAVLAFGLVGTVGEANAATQGSLALLQSFNPDAAAKNILKGFAMFIALVAIFVAVGRFARGAMMQGFGVLLGGGILFAIALAPDSLSEFGGWVLEQFGLGLIPFGF